MNPPKFFDDLSEQLYNDLTTDTLFSKFFDVEICPGFDFYISSIKWYEIWITGTIQFSLPHGLCIPYKIGLNQRYDAIMIENDDSRKYIVEKCIRFIQEETGKVLVEVQRKHPDLLAMSYMIPAK